jgi:hypothetical protein
MYPARYQEIAASPSGRSEDFAIYNAGCTDRLLQLYKWTFLVCYTLYDRNLIFKAID